jgi:thioredoxin 1
MVQVIHTEQEIHQTIKSFQGLVVIDVFATWCGPCKLLSPKLDKMEQEFTNVKFIKVDADEVSNFADKNEITAMPTIIFIKNGVEVNRITGLNEVHISNMIKKYM